MRAVGAIIPALLLCIMLGGCATTGTGGMGTAMENDPLEGFNRAMFTITIKADKAIFRPTALAYRKVVPESLRVSLRNFLANLNTPVIFANDVLQAEVSRAGVTLARGAINSTLGIGGLVDIATRWGLPHHTEDFGQTLAVYGVGEGFYLFIPLLGPSNPPDLFGYAADFLFDP